ncbi:MAG: hypothetical protein Q4C15_11815 [Eubacteriales bacterium]|nr:hypothetical protein [Eubacteriales bacterium]
MKKPDEQDLITDLEELTEAKPKKRQDTKMRNCMICIPEKMIAKKDYPELGIKTGDTVIYTFEDNLRILEEWAKTKMLSYYAICHNSDPANTHTHIVIDFHGNSSATFSQIKSHWNFGKIDSCEHGVRACVQYLVHYNDPYKTQYPWEAIVTNNISKLETYKTKGESSLEKWYAYYLNLILIGRLKEYEIERIDPQVYIQYERQFRAAFEYVKKTYIASPDRDIQVIVIQGASRVGKGVFIKDWARKQNKAVCFSSTSNDPWQDYRGHEIFVYDDNTFENLKIQDLIKILDPHNNTTMHARYRNRVFMGDTIFVCTNTPVTSWYLGEEAILREALFRRISCVLDFAESEGAKVTYTINDLCMTESGWKLKQLGEKTFDISNIIDISADERKKQQFIDSLD